jgi:DNA-directed RNA polymerase delta subunit
MNKTSLPEYHIELTELRNFVNNQIETGKLDSVRGMVVFKSLKDAVMGTEIKPFLSAPAKGESNSYYEKYYNLERHPEYATKNIPEFFSSGKDFYDLDAILNIYKEKIKTESFKVLFLLKLYQLESTGLSIEGFLDFQIHDNFYGDKKNLVSFLYQFLANDGIFCLLPTTISLLNNWINKEEIDEATLKKTKEKSKGSKRKVSDNSVSNFKEEVEIKGHFSIEEIRKYFSFLYEEKSANKKPFLGKEEVEEIFKNGLIIPISRIQTRYNLNVDNVHTKSIVDFGIHKFYTNNSKTHKDKKYYLQFFGSYIEDYAAALESKEKLDSLLSNFSVNKVKNNRIKWNEYLPQRFR